MVNYASSGVNKLKASLDDDARVVIYDHHIFIAQATGSMSKYLSYTLVLLAADICLITHHRNIFFSRHA